MDEYKKFLEYAHLTLRLIKESNDFVLQRLIVLILRNAPLDAVPVVCTILEVPVAGLVPDADVVGEPRVDTHLSQSIMIALQLPVAIEAVLTWQDLSAQVDESLSSNQPKQALLWVAPGGEAGARSRLEHAECFLKLALAVLHYHEGEVRDVGFKGRVGKRKAHVISEASVNHFVIRRVLLYNPFEIDPLSIVHRCVVSLCIDDNFVTFLASERTLLVLLLHHVNHDAREIAGDKSGALALQEGFCQGFRLHPSATANFDHWASLCRHVSELGALDDRREFVAVKAMIPLRVFVPYVARIALELGVILLLYSILTGLVRLLRHVLLL